MKKTNIPAQDRLVNVAKENISAVPEGDRESVKQRLMLLPVPKSDAWISRVASGIKANVGLAQDFKITTL